MSSAYVVEQQPTTASRRVILRLGALSAVGAIGTALLSACGGTATGSATANSSSTAASQTAPASSAASSAATSAAPATATTSAAAASTTTVATSAASTTSAAPTSAVASTSASAAARPAASGVTVEWWSGWGTGGNAQKTLNAVGVAANKVASGYQVQHDAQSSAAKKLTAAIAAGTPPDVETGNLPYTQYWATGLAEPLDSYLAKSTTLKKGDLLASSWTFGSYNGKTYGIPAIEAFVRWGMAANQDMLAAKSLDPTAMPATWEELLDWHKKLTVLDPGTKAIRQIGIDPLDGNGTSGSGGDPFFWGPAYDFTYYDEAKRQFNLVNTQHEAVLTMIKSFYDVMGGYDAVQTFRNTNKTGTGTKSSLALGTEAQYVDGYWVPGSMTKEVPDKRYAYAWAPVGANRKGAKIQSSGGHFAVLPRGAPHPEQAFALSEYLTTDDAQQIIYDGLGWIGARPSFLTKIDTSKYPGLDFYVKSATTATQFYNPVSCPIDDFFITTWVDQVNQMLQGKVSAHDALQQMQQLCTAQLAQQKG